MRALVVSVLSLAACATSPPAPINLPLAAPASAVTHETNSGEDVLVLAFSGGGARAASFSLGVLQGLDAMRSADGRPLSEHVSLITAVSGGAILAAYYGQNGREGLSTFRAAYLDKEWDVEPNFLAPTDWWRAYRGGVNGPSRLGDWLDTEVFSGARMPALDAGPRIVINATDLFNGAPFAFTPLWFGAICSDLARVRVADAVAASMAVPLVFRPVLLESYPGACASQPNWTDAARVDRNASEIVRSVARAFDNYRDADTQRFLHLVDGGVTDNFGLAGLIVARRASGAAYAPLTAREAVRARRIVFLVVNAERLRSLEWQHSAQGPGGGEAVYTAFDVSVDAAKRGAFDAFRALLPVWQSELIAYRCGLSAQDVTRLRGDAEGWACADVTLAADMIAFADLDADAYAALTFTPTAVTLPPDAIDALVAGGRAAVERNGLARALTAPVE